MVIRFLRTYPKTILTMLGILGFIALLIWWTKVAIWLMLGVVGLWVLAMLVMAVLDFTGEG